MKTFIIKVNEIHTREYRVKAKNKTEAIAKLKSDDYCCDCGEDIKADTWTEYKKTTGIDLPSIYEEQ